MNVTVPKKEKEEPKVMRAAAFEPGGPEKLTITSVPMPVLKTQEILVKIYASAINRADTLQRQGKYPPPPGCSQILGLEAAGVVEEVSNDVTKWQVGDRVMTLLGGGGNAEYVNVHEDHVMPIPDGFSFKDAASIPETWLTAYQIIYTIGQLQKGESILIHAAGSGVGLAAVQLASKLSDAKVYVTAGTQSKIDAALSFGAKAGFNYREGDFSSKILEVTGGKGVNLILDCVGGSMWEQNIESVALDGTWVLYGTLGGPMVNGPLIGKILQKRVKLQGTTLRTRSNEYKTNLVKKFSENALPLFKTGALQTVIDSEYPLGKLAQAHQHMEENKNIGKIVILIRYEENE